MGLERRFGTGAGCMTLLLNDEKGNKVALMSNEMASIGSYGIKNNFIIHCIDEDPNSILRQIENADAVEKYMISDEDYNNLPSFIKSECSKI